MTRKTTVLLVAGATVATVLAAIAVAVSVSSDGKSSQTPTAQQASVPDPNSPPAPDDPAPQPKLTEFADRGDPAQVARVRSAVPELIRRANLAVASPPTPAERAAMLRDAARTSARHAELRAVFAPSTVDETIRSMEGALRQVQDDVGYTGYSDYKLNIDGWFGIKVDGNRAFAGFRAHQSFLKTSGWRDEGSAPWHVWLERDGDTWKLVVFKARPPNS